MLHQRVNTEICCFSAVAQNIIQLAKDDGFLIGGELGAALATSYLHPQSATLHIEDNYRAIATKLKLKPSTQGEIIFLKQFGNQNFWQWGYGKILLWYYGEKSYERHLYRRLSMRKYPL
ncbi:MAG: hypothetical protein DSM106950_05795 [Stigonema ocellatum SAG 48.90 = DSM 106950]|nr:hypothetical protein [Stigonema ocellatum SAG 48.90 = DSM 106950]